MQKADVSWAETKLDTWVFMYNNNFPRMDESRSLIALKSDYIFFNTVTLKDAKIVFYGMVNDLT